MENIVSNMEIKDVNYKVPSLERGLDILEFLSVRKGGVSLQEIKRELDLSQTTAYRILNTMARHGFIAIDEKTKLYSLTRKMLSLGFRTLEEHDLLKKTIPYLHSLRDEIKETVCFGVLGEEKGVFIEQAQGLHTFRFVLSPGKSFDLHCSAPGKAIMAYLPRAARERYLKQMKYEIYNDRTISNESDYIEELKKVKKEGYALDNEEEISGVICIGVPIFNYTKTPCGSIWISGPKDRLDAETIADIAMKIKETATKVSQELGY